VHHVHPNWGSWRRKARDGMVGRLTGSPSACDLSKPIPSVSTPAAYSRARIEVRIRPCPGEGRCSSGSVRRP
jgi:hypothetical protein